MDFLQTLGEKLSSFFNPSSVLEDVVSAQNPVPVQKSMPSPNLPRSVEAAVKSTSEQSSPEGGTSLPRSLRHKCTCGGH